MPLMVEDHDMMDDLFGDGDNDGLNAALAATMDNDTLRQKVEESHRLGCCQKLVWSRNGSLAHISADGQKVTIRALMRDPLTGKALLSGESSKPIVAEDDACLVHVEWSMSGSELIVTDQFGRISIHAMALALNRLQPVKMSYDVPQDDLSTVIGLHWLATTGAKQRVPIFGPSVRQGQHWCTDMKAYEFQNVAHPLEGRSAILCVTRSNHLKLIFQQPSQPWSEAGLGLGEMTSSADILTHATFGDINGQLLLVTYDASKSLRLYRMQIEWNDQQHGKPPSVNPVLSVTHIQLLDRVLPQTPSAAELSSILIQPPAIGVDRGHIQISAVFNCLPDEQQINHHTSARGSVVARWELRQSEVVLHEVFKALKPGTDKINASKPRQTLHRLDDVLTSKIYIGICDNPYHDIFAFVCSDGTVDFRHRETMDIIGPDADSDKVSSVPQAGFSFLPVDCTEMALSPSGCLAVISKQDGTLDLHVPEFVHGWADATSDDQLPQAAMVALAREAGILFCHSLQTDDILAVIPIDLDRGLRRRFIAEILRTLAKNTDYTPEEAAKDKSKAMKDTLLFKALSLQLMMGYDKNPAIRDIPGKLAWAMLSVRNTSSIIMNTVGMANSSHILPDIMLSLKDLAKWHFDLMHMLINDLLTILRAYKSQQQSTSSASPAPKITKEFIQQQIAANGNTPTLHILLHSTSRHLLRFLADVVRHYFQRTIPSKTHARDLAQRAGFAELEAMVTHYIAFKLPVFEQLLVELDTAARKAYAEGNVDYQARRQSEQTMLVEGTIPDALMPVLEGLFERQVPKLMERVDGVKVFLAETKWLGFGDDAVVIAAAQQKRSDGGGKVVDVVRKVEVTRRGRAFRRCRRCASLVEDLWEERGMMPWVMYSQRTCVCLSFWVV